MKTITGTWQNSSGQPVANGRLTLKLSQDAVASGTSQVAPILISITLDGTGSIPAATQIFANDELQPSGTTYSASVLAAGGGLAWGAENISIVGASPININNLTPISVAGAVVFGNAVLLNPTAAQTITSFPLTINSNLSIGGTLAVTGAVTLSSTINKVTITQPATGSTITIADGKTLAVNNTLTFVGTDSTTLTFQGTDTYVGRTTTDNLTNKTITSPSISNPTTTGNDTGVETLTNKTIGSGGLFGIGFHQQKFTGNGTFTIPAGITQVKVLVIAAGGAGGGGTGATAAGSGGGSGSSAVKYLSSLTPGNTLTVTVGAGGTGVSGLAGNPGSNSSVSSGTQVITTIATNAGLGGGASASIPGSGGAQGTGGDQNNGGNVGDIALTTNNLGGDSGASFLGGAVVGGNGNNPGNAGTAPGAGGSGGGGTAGNTTGGAGADGVVIFEWVN